MVPSTSLRQRKKIWSDNFNFPSDLYIIQGIIENLSSDYEIDLIESKDNISISMEKNTFENRDWGLNEPKMDTYFLTSYQL